MVACHLVVSPVTPACFDAGSTPQPSTCFAIPESQRPIPGVRSHPVALCDPFLRPSRPIPLDVPVAFATWDLPEDASCTGLLDEGNSGSMIVAHGLRRRASMVT